MGEAPAKRLHSQWLPFAGGLLAIYIVIRLVANYSSWQAPLPASAEEDNRVAKEAGDTYALMVADNSQKNARDTQIQTLWRLIQMDQWKLPADIRIGDAPDLARELQARASAYYQANNLGQAASCIKILLRWSVLMLNSSGGSQTAIQPQLGATLAQISLDTLESCPAIYTHPEIKRDVDQLRLAIENSAGIHFNRMLGHYLYPEAHTKSEKVATWKLLANRDVLESFLRAYMSGQFGNDKKSGKLRGAQLKSWVLICPMTWNLFSQSLRVLQEQSRVNASLLGQIKRIQAGSLGQPPAASAVPPA